MITAFFFFYYFPVYFVFSLFYSEIFSVSYTFYPLCSFLTLMSLTLSNLTLISLTFFPCLTLHFLIVIFITLIPLPLLSHQHIPLTHLFLSFTLIPHPPIPLTHSFLSPLFPLFSFFTQDYLEHSPDSHVIEQDKEKSENEIKEFLHEQVKILKNK